MIDMDMENKKGLRWRIFKWFGPHEVQNLINHIDEMSDLEGSTGEIAIYPLGEFSFNVKTSEDGEMEPLVFPTPQERACFQTGMHYGVSLMGGTTTALTQDDYEVIEEMRKGMNSGGNKKMH